MAGQIDGKRVLILATHGFEQSELETPRDRLKAAGAQVDIVSPEHNGVITSRNPGDLEDFSNKIIEEIREGKHQRKAA